MDYTENFYKKYIKYKLKYNNLKSSNLNNTKSSNLDNTKSNNMEGGGRYECKPQNNFKDICVENENGKYKSKDGCVNDCEVQYIREQLKKVNIDRESSQFYLFIKDIIKNEKVDVYLKGGNVLGLKVLKMIYDKYKNNETEFKKVFKEFLKLELIKDWDFA